MDASTSISAYLSKTTLEDEETSGFRILDAPREVRDKIYEHVLKVYVPAAELHRPAPAFERPNTAILYINRQINEEASRIFATSNKFVCVKTNVKCLISGCRPKAIAWMNPSK